MMYSASRGGSGFVAGTQTSTRQKTQQNSVGVEYFQV